MNYVPPRIIVGMKIMSFKGLANNKRQDFWVYFMQYALSYFLLLAREKC